MGYRIPKGATVIANHWSIHMDEDVYGDPETFRPERWIEEPNLPLYAFGFGGRICPGQHLARDSLNIVMSRMLWAFNFHRAMKDGKTTYIDPNAFTSGFNSRPEPFQVFFEPRTQRHKEVILREFAEMDKEIKSYLPILRQRPDGDAEI